MTKRELSTAVADKIGEMPANVETIANELFGQIKKAAENGENVYIRGFGTFAITKRVAKTARDIARNTKVMIPARNVVKFKPSREFKAAQ